MAKKFSDRLQQRFKRKVEKDKIERKQSMEEFDRLMPRIRIVPLIRRQQNVT